MPYGIWTEEDWRDGVLFRKRDESPPREPTWLTARNYLHVPGEAGTVFQGKQPATENSSEAVKHAKLAISLQAHSDVQCPRSTRRPRMLKIRGDSSMEPLQRITPVERLLSPASLRPHFDEKVRNHPAFVYPLPCPLRCKTDTLRDTEGIILAGGTPHRVQTATGRKPLSMPEITAPHKLTDVTFLSYCAVVEKVSTTNFAGAAARDVLDRVKREGPGAGETEEKNTSFTDRYFHAIHLFGNLTDKVREILLKVESQEKQWNDPDESDSEVELAVHGSPSGGRPVPSLVRGLREITGPGKPRGNSSAVQRLGVVRTLKDVLQNLDSFSLEQQASDLRQWVQLSEVGQAHLREFLDQIGDLEQEVLTLIALSRSLIEEYLTTHSLTAATALATFCDLVARHLQSVDRRRHLQGGADLGYSHLLSVITKDFRQLQDDSARLTRHVQVTRALHEHVLAATRDRGEKPVADAEAGAMAARGLVKRSSLRTLVVHATVPTPAGAQVALMKGEEARCEGVKAEMEPWLAHAMGMFERCRVDGQASLILISARVLERNALSHKLKRHVLQLVTSEKRGAQEEASKKEDEDADGSRRKMLVQRRQNLQSQLQAFDVGGEERSAAEVGACLEETVTSSETVKVRPVGAVADAWHKEVSEIKDSVQALVQDASAGAVPGTDPTYHIANGLDTHSSRSRRMSVSTMRGSLEWSVEKKELQLQSLCSLCEKMTGNVNDMFGSRTWLFDKSSLRIWFGVNPWQLVLTEIRRGFEAGLVMFGSRDASRSVLVDIEVLVGMFKAESLERGTCLTDKTEFDEEAWAGRTNKPMEALLQRVWNMMEKQNANIRPEPEKRRSSAMTKRRGAVVAGGSRLQSKVSPRKTKRKSTDQGSLDEDELLEKTADAMSDSCSAATAVSQALQARKVEIQRTMEMARELTRARLRSVKSTSDLANLTNEAACVVNQLKELQLEEMRAMVGMGGTDSFLTSVQGARTATFRDQSHLSRGTMKRRTVSVDMSRPVLARRPSRLQRRSLHPVRSTRQSLAELGQSHQALLADQRSHGVGQAATLQAENVPAHRESETSSDTESDTESDSPPAEVRPKRTQLSWNTGRTSDASFLPRQGANVSDKEGTRSGAEPQEWQSTAEGSSVRDSGSRWDADVEGVRHSGRRASKWEAPNIEGRRTSKWEAQFPDALQLQSFRDSTGGKSSSSKGSRLTTHSSFDVDKVKNDMNIDQARQKAHVLEMRMERKRQELVRMCNRVRSNQKKREVGGMGSLPKKSWETQISEMRANLRTTLKMIDFWKTRLAQWQQEVLEKHGEAVVAELNRETKDRDLATVMHRGSWMERGSVTGSVSVGHRPSVMRTEEVSHVFQQASRTLDALLDARSPPRNQHPWDLKLKTSVCDQSLSSEHVGLPQTSGGHSGQFPEVIQQPMPTKSRVCGGGFQFSRDRNEPVLDFPEQGFDPEDSTHAPYLVARGHKTAAVGREARSEVLRLLAGSSAAQGLAILCSNRRPPLEVGSRKDSNTREQRLYRGAPRTKVGSRSTLESVVASRCSASAEAAGWKRLSGDTRRRSRSPDREAEHEVVEKRGDTMFSLFMLDADRVPEVPEESAESESPIRSSPRRTPARVIQPTLSHTATVRRRRISTSPDSVTSDISGLMIGRVADSSACDGMWSPIREASDSSSENGLLPERSSKSDMKWFVDDDRQQTLRLLRLCREKLVQRFGSTDKAFAQIVPSTTLQMTQGLFRDLVGGIGFDDAACARMYKALFTWVSACRRSKKEQETRAVGGSRVKEQALARQEFVDALRNTLPVRTLAQLRVRLHQQYSGLEVAFSGAGDSDEMDIDTFRNLLAGVGASGAEARKLFMEMCRQSETISRRTVTRQAFLLCLWHAEGLAAAKKVKTAVTSLMPKAMEPSVRRTSLGKAFRRQSDAGFPEQLVPLVVDSRRGSIPLSPADDTEGSEPSAEQHCADSATESTNRSWSFSRRSSNSRVLVRTPDDLTSHRFNLADSRQETQALFETCMTALIPPQRAGCGYPLLLSREDFCKSVEPFGLSIVDAHAIFKLVTTRRGAKVPLQDLVTRILGGLGRQHDALRTRLGLPVSVLDDNGSAAPAQAVGGQWETSITVKNSSPTQRHQLLLKARRSTKRQRRRAESAPCERVHVTGTKEDDEARGTTSPSMVHHAARSNSFESESDAARRSGVARKRWGLPSIANRVRGVQALCGIKVKSVTTGGVRVEDNAPRDPVREGSFASHFKFGHKTFDDGLSGVDELLSAKVCRRNLPSKYVPSGGGPGAVCEAVEHFMNSAARKLASARSDGARLPAVGIPLGPEDSVDDVPVPARGLLGNALRGTERPRTGQVVANAESVSASHSHDFLKVVNKASAAAHSDNDKAWNFDEGSCENPAFAKSEDPGDIELGTEPLELAAREVTECERQVQRRELFGGDAFQLEIATRKLQEVRLRFMARFRTPGRTFDSLAGSRTASVTVSVFQDRVIAWKIFNALDAKRVASLITTLGESPLLSYAEFLQILSFAMPTHSLLGFRKRLVQQYGSLEAALHILGLSDVEELSIDIFDRCLLAAGVLPEHAQRIFSMIDAVQPDGPCGFLSLDAIRFAVDHAQVISWLGLLHGILGGGAVLRATLLATAPLEKVMSDPSELEEVVQQFGFLTMLAEPTFALLQRCGDGTVTLGGLAHVLEAAFTDSYEEVAGRSKLGGPGTVNRLAGLMDARREMSLMLLAQLRLTVLERFSNYQDAFQVFKAARLEGVTLDEWEAAMPSFQFTDPERWCLIFGHLVGWRHPRWTLAYRGSEMRISLADFAAALRTAVPCRTLSALRVRLQEVCPSVQKAWHRLSGKEGVDEIGSVQWVTALQHFGVRIADANCLFAMLQALHCIEFGAVGGASKTVARSVFLSALRASSAEAHTRLFSVLTSFQDSCTAASESFEVTYPRDLVASTSFERYAMQILKVSRADAGCFFWLLDTQRDGVISVDDLLDHLTTLQETYIPQTPGDITRADVRAEKLWVSLEASAKGVTGGSGVSQTRSRAQGLSLRLCPTTEIADGLNLVDSKPSQRQSAAESCAQDAPTQQPLPNFSGWKRSLVEEEGHLKPEHVEQNVALNKMSCPVVSKSSPERNPLQVLARASAPAPLKEKRGQLSTHRFLLKSSKPTLAQDDPCFPWSDSGVMVSSARGWRSTGSATAASAAAAAIIAGRPTEPSEVVEASRTALFNGLPVRARVKTKSMG